MLACVDIVNVVSGFKLFFDLFIVRHMFKEVRMTPLRMQEGCRGRGLRINCER